MDPQEVIRRNNFEKPKYYNEYVPTEKDRKIVYSYAAYGATTQDIAAALGINWKTVDKYFEEELKSGRAVAKNTIAQRIYQIAIGREAIIDPDSKQIIAPPIKPNLSALIFLAKVRLGWKETQVLESSVEMKSTGVKIYLPDNGMRCEEDKND